MKQTAVEFLIEEFNLNKDDFRVFQAKDIEKFQIIDAYETGLNDYANFNYKAENGIDYYKITYNAD